MIGVFRPSYDHSEAAAVAEVLASGWSGTGPRVKAFEEAFAEYCGGNHCVTTASGTAALAMALRLIGIGRGDQVIIPGMTFVSAAHTVMAEGATPVFCDVLPGTLNIDPGSAASLVCSRTRAVIPVHLAGRPVDVGELSRALPGIPVLEDCAHASGSRFRGKHVGTAGFAGCFSFGAVKNISMGEGGALLLHQQEVAARASRLRWLGIDRETWDRTNMDRAYWWEYRVEETGFSCRMDDIHAAIGLVQLKKLDGANARRRQIARRYAAALSDLEEVGLPEEDSEESVSSWHMYRIEAQRRDRLNQYLGEKGISTGVHYKPLNLYACYGRQPRLPVAEAAFSRILTLPVYPDLTDQQVDLVADSIRKFYRG